MINSLDNGDVINSNRKITKAQSIMFLDLLDTFNKLLEDNISSDRKLEIRADIGAKISKYITLVREDKLKDLGI
jgi:hypothetical protein